MKNPFSFIPKFNTNKENEGYLLQEKLKEFLIPEAWIEVGTAERPPFQNGWTSTNHFGFRYLKAIASVQIHGRIVPGTETDGTVIFTLPESYRPLSNAYSYHIVSDVAGASGARLEVNTNGDVKIYNADTVGTFYDVNIIYPINI